MSELDTFVFLSPWWLLLSGLFFLSALLLNRVNANNDWQKVLHPVVWQFLGASQESHKKRINYSLLCCALVSASLSQPAVKTSDDDTWSHAIGWIVIADVSRSMTINDIVPSRLSAMRETAIQLSRAAAARSISLIIFAGDAFLVAPPAFDQSVYKENVILLEYGLIPTEGSNLTRALSLATTIIQESDLEKARLFLLSDSGGINTNSINAAQYLGKLGHRLDVLLFGTADRTVIDSTVQNDTQVDLSLARALSEAAGGQVAQADQFGVIDYQPLDLQSGKQVSSEQSLQALVWRQQSHWLLLLCIPWVLLLFKQEKSV